MRHRPRSPRTRGRSHSWTSIRPPLASLYATESRPFTVPDTGKIAVKVINDYGDEVMQVFEVN
jgi:hypothetical protein